MTQQHSSEYAVNCLVSAGRCWCHEPVADPFSFCSELLFWLVASSLTLSASTGSGSDGSTISPDPSKSKVEPSKPYASP